MTNYTSDTTRFCSVYKSPKKAEMYVYVDRKEGVDSLPEAFVNMFGEPQHVLDMILTPEKKLARVDSGQVLEAIAEKGFYLQMPPPEGTDVAGDVQMPNDSLNG